ncbi:hypothetical protein ABQE16_08790 [Enterococcus avium]|nr:MULTISPECIES: hypothetical protein [Enterococcus]MCO5489309.1 hypothetical protein [Enterococcus faecalis]MDT2493732.1 hypothetical protein [Enterococcus avium]
MYIIFILALLITTISLVIVYFMFKLIQVNENKARLITLTGELFLVMSAVLFFTINSSILDQFNNSDLYVIKESLRKIEIRLNHIERNQHLDEPTERSHNSNTISEMEEHVEYSNMQIDTAEKITLFFTTLGTICLFVGKICSYKIFVEKEKDISI